MGRYRLWSSVVLLSAAAGLAGCGKGKAERELIPPTVTVIRPVEVPVRDYWTYNGYLDTTRAVEVRSKIRGFLSEVLFNEGAEVKKGDPLYTLDKREFETARNKAKAELAKAKADAVKAVADVKRAAADIKNWEAQIIQAKADLERTQRAVSSGAESKTELDKAKATLEVREAERDAAKAAHTAAQANAEAAEANAEAADAALRTTEIQLGYTDIAAKIDGRISRTLMDEGNLVLADTTVLTTIVAVDKLYVYFDAPEGDFLAFRPAVGVSPTASQKIPVEVGVTDEFGYPHEGYIDFQENRVETATGTIRVRGRIDNPVLSNGNRPLYPGLYARVRVPKGDPKPQLAIPEDCLMSGQEGRFVWVVGEGNKVAKRVVSVGAVVWKAPPAEPGVVMPGWVAVNPKPKPPAEGQPPADTRKTIRSVVAITSGLEMGDRVIFQGLQQARPNAPVNPDEWVLTPPPAPAVKQ